MQKQQDKNNEKLSDVSDFNQIQLISANIVMG